MSLDTKFLATGDLVNSANSTTTAGKVGAYHTGGTASGCAILGDNAYNDGSSSDFTSNFDPDWGTYLFKSGRAWIRPTPGSHDFGAWGASGAVGSGITGYKSYYSTTKSLPIWDSSHAPNAGIPYDSYFYSEPILDTAGGSTKWLLISACGVKGVTSNVDTDGLMVALASGSSQYTWLQDVLTAANTAGQYCMIISGHAYYSCTDDHHGPETRIKPIWDLIQSTGMMGRCVVLSGHHHNYQRFKPQDNNGNVKTDSTGCAQFIVGTAGLSTGYAKSNTPTNWATLPGGGDAYTNTVHGFAEFTLKDTGYDFKFINSANDAVFDSGSVTLAVTSSGPGSPPPDTTSTFTIPTEDNGLFIRCVVTANNADGSTITPTAAALIGGSSALPVNQAAPSISPAAPFVLDTLTANPGTWGNTPTSYQYQWQTQDSSGTITTLGGATSVTYQTVQTQVGLRLRVLVTATNGSGTSAASASNWTAPLQAGAPVPVPIPTSPSLWQVVITDAAGQPISNITPICAQKTLTFMLNRPASMNFVIKSDDTSVAGTHSDGFPYLHELNRGIRAYRFEDGQYVLRFAGHIWQIEDQGDTEKCQTAVTCFDPLMMANARIVRRMTADQFHANLVNNVLAYNVLDWTPTANHAQNSQSIWPIYDFDTGTGTASPDDRAFTFDLSNIDSIALAEAIIDRANSVGWTGISSGKPTNPQAGLEAFWNLTTENGTTCTRSASLYGGFPFGRKLAAYHFENSKAVDSLIQLSEAYGFDFICVPDESTLTIGTHGQIGQPMLGFDSGVVKQFGYLRIFADTDTSPVFSNMVLGYGAVPNNVATISRLIDGTNWVNANIGVGDTISTVYAHSANMRTLGLSEDIQNESDISIPQLLEALIVAETEIAANGKTTITVGLQPGMANSFEPWSDFDLGEYAIINAGPLLRGGFSNGRVRIYGFTLTIDADKGEIVSSLELAPSTSTGAL